MSAEADQIDEDHPLVLEISSLKAAANRFQDEAHSASLKLQRFSLDTSTAQDRIAYLERENARLLKELKVLRANPHPDSSPASHPAVLQSQELTLSLRRLSEKLSLTEQALLERTTELAHATSEVAKSRLTVENAYALAARTRGREEEGKLREQELEMKNKELEEELKMEDLVVKEYADLVRSLEGRNNIVHTKFGSVHSDGSTATLVDGVSEGKAGLQKLFAEFSVETERLHAEVEKLKGELAASNAQLRAEKHGADADRVLLATVQKEFEMLKMEDKSAASMVSRYMKFSQASTNSLQESFNVLKTRHSATIDTFSGQIANLSTQLQTSQATADKLRTVVDELGKDIMREGHGRRREIALRLKLAVREEALQEALGRWIRRGQEILDQEHEHIQRSSLEKMLYDARAVYAVLDTPAAAKAPLAPIPESQFSPYTAPSGSLARIIAAEASVHSLIEELQIQTARRQELEPAAAANQPLLPVLINGGPKKQILSEADATRSSQQLVETISHSSEAPEDISNPPEILEPKESQLTLSLPEVDQSVIESPDASSTTPSLDEREPTTEAPDSSAVPSSEVTPDIEPMFKVIEQHPLIDELSYVSHRYDDLQRSFRDCHLALQELRKVISSGDATNASPPAPTINGVSYEIFQASVERLDNYNEDARVELEIRAADEALLAQGYKTILSLTGSSLTTASISTLAQSVYQDEAELTAGELEAQIREFVSGTDLNVQRAQQSLLRKLADVQNDIAVLKRAMHDPDAFVPSFSSTTPTVSGLNSSPGANNSGWTTWIRTSPRPASPSPAPTFGHVMTSPRLKHSSSFHEQGSRRRGSMGELNSQHVHPFSNLDLRVSMPALSPSSRSVVFSPPGIDWHGPRTRTVSTMNMLGLGTPSGGASPQQNRSASLTSEMLQEGKEDDIE